MIFARTVALALGALALAVTAPPAATAQQLVSVRLVLGVAVTSANGYYAHDYGFFTANGLDVQLTQMHGGAAEAAALAGNAADFADGNLVSFANAIIKGIPFVAVAPGMLYDSRDPYAVLGVAPSSPYRTAKDLNGKIIGEPSLGGMAEAAIAAWAEDNGGDWKSYKYVEIPVGESVPALLQGRIDAVVFQDPQLAEEGSSIRTLAKNYDWVAKRFLTTAWFTTTTYAARNPDVVRRFQQAIDQAGAWADRNPELARADLEKWLKLKVAKLRRTGRVDKLDPALIQPMLDFAAKNHFIQRQMAASEMIYTPVR